MDFYFLRLSLKRITNLFAADQAAGKGVLTRQEWLIRTLTKEHRFTHSNSSFVYVPEESASGGDGILFGWIARERVYPERTPPSEGLEPTEHVSWQAAFVMVDVTEHDDGQKIVMENVTSIGAPNAILKSFIKYINLSFDAPYFGEVFPIVEEGSFKTFAQAHNNRIKSITLDVVAPNMFSDVNDFQNELRSLRDQENVSRVRATLESDTILNSTARLGDIADYTERGAGTLSAVAEDGETYHSEKHNKHTSVVVEPHFKNKTEFLKQIVAQLSRFF